MSAQAVAHTFPEPAGGDVDRGWALLAVCWAFVLCAFLSTALRIYVRGRITRNLGWDDYNMMIAMFLTVIGVAVLNVQLFYGIGRHQYYLTPRQRKLFVALGWGDWIQTFVCLMFVKISICLFLLRIVPTRKTKIAMYATIGFTVGFTAVCSFLFLGICRPIRAYWTVGVEGRCLSKRQVMNVVVAQGALSVITDLICASFPIIVLRNLQVKLSTKVGLCILMGLGVITAICCTVRTILSGAMLDDDISWAIVDNVGWRLPEVNIGIVCANAPILRPLYLYSRGQLIHQRTSNTFISGDRAWPSTNKNKTKTRLEQPSLEDGLKQDGLKPAQTTYERGGEKERGRGAGWMVVDGEGGTEMV